jgi:uncharacterized protein (DUF697 family)
MEDAMHDIDRDMNPEFESFEFEQFEMLGEPGSVFSEAEEMELAGELLGVRDEQELDQFLGDLIKKAGHALGGIIRSPIGQAVGGALKGLARKALPIAGGALGTFVGGPVGTAIGSGLASAAGKALGLELESLNQEDREFEGAKQFVRLAGEAVKNAQTASPAADPRAVGQHAVARAAQALAPALLRGASGALVQPTSGAVGHGQSGRWIRRGSRIVLLGV